MLRGLLLFQDFLHFFQNVDLNRLENVLYQMAFSFRGHLLNPDGFIVNCIVKQNLLLIANGHIIIEVRWRSLLIYWFIIMNSIYGYTMYIYLCVYLCTYLFICYLIFYFYLHNFIAFVVEGVWG